MRICAILAIFCSIAVGESPKAQREAEPLRQILGYEIDERGFTKGTISLRPGTFWPIESDQGSNLILIFNGNRIRVPKSDMKIWDVQNTTLPSRNSGNPTTVTLKRSTSGTIVGGPSNSVHQFKKGDRHPIIDETFSDVFLFVDGQKVRVPKEDVEFENSFNGTVNYMPFESPKTSLSQKTTASKPMIPLEVIKQMKRPEQFISSPIEKGKTYYIQGYQSYVNSRGVGNDYVIFSKGDPMVWAKVPSDRREKLRNNPRSVLSVRWYGSTGSPFPNETNWKYLEMMILNVF